MPEVISDQERELAKDVASFAMIAGWERAFQRFSRDTGLREHEIILVLNRATDYNDKADPSGRIHELEDWVRERKGRSQQAAPRGQGKTPARSSYPDDQKRSSLFDAPNDARGR